MNIADVSSCHCIELDYTAIKAYGPINEQKTNGLFFIVWPPPPGFPVEPCGELVLGITGLFKQLASLFTI